MNNCKECTIRAARSGMFALVAGILGATPGMASAAENACVQAFPDDITLRAALDAAPANPKKHYTIVLTDDCTLEDGNLEVNGRISIVGNGKDINADFSGSADYIFIVGETGDLTLNDVNLINTVTTDAAGAIFNDGGTVTYNGGLISGFYTLVGAIVNFGSKMTLNDLTIGDNLAQGGAGIANTGQLTVNNSLIGVDEDNNPMPNVAGLGGGIYNTPLDQSPGELSLNNTIVAENEASNVTLGIEGGGGVYNDEGATLNLNSNTEIRNNNAYDGGGIFNAGTVNVNRAEIRSNLATNDGGGVWNNDTGVITINRGEISGNTATDVGGGVYNAGTLTNNKFGSITNNSPDDVYDDGTCVSRGEIDSVSNGSCPPSNP